MNESTQAHQNKKILEFWKSISKDYTGNTQNSSLGYLHFFFFYWQISEADTVALCVFLQPPSVNHSLCCQHGRVELAELHMFQACSDASLLLSISLPLMRARQCRKRKEEGRIHVTSSAVYQSHGFPHPLSLPPSLSFCTLPLSLGTPTKKKSAGKKVISSKQLLGFAFKPLLLNRCEWVCMCVCVGRSLFLLPQ